MDLTTCDLHGLVLRSGGARLQPRWHAIPAVNTYRFATTSKVRMTRRGAHST
jgi:hypothetical protein